LFGALVGRDIGTDPWPDVSKWVLRHPGRELAVRAELLGLAAGPVTFPTPPANFQSWFDHPLRPVSGLLVVDFSALWAGPLCAHILGLAGARVVKVETPQRPDGARRGNADFYRLLHAGHASVVLDPGTAAGRRAMAELVQEADIVIEASRPRALAGFGLDAAAAVAAGCTWISITANGRASARVGFGDDVAAGSGLVAVDDQGLPLFVGDALADPLTGLAAAALAMSEPAAGGGILRDVPMSHVVAATLPAVRSAGFSAGSATASRDAAGHWQLEAGSDSYRVQGPRRRSPAGDASARGADTGSVLRRLGISVP
jgi:crotonobetainyl-CoA:carnitine CoA-transferase CaiB-like acyl-CoA transferase